MHLSGKEFDTTVPRSQTKRNSPKLVRHIVDHDFHGDEKAFQLTFKTGAIILVDPRHPPRQGWIWVMDVETSRQGWCPLSYLTPEQSAKAPPQHTSGPMPSMSAGYVDDAVRDGEDNGGFAGEIMGGQAATTKPTVHYQNGTSHEKSPTTNNFFSNIGTSLQDVGKRSMTAVCTGAQKAGEFTKTVAQESKYRVQDMNARRNNQDSAMTEKTTHSNQHGRAPGEQKAVNIGNRAAQGAAAGAAVGLDFGGVRGATRGAARCGAWGGAREAVRDWKSFG